MSETTQPTPAVAPMSDADRIALLERGCAFLWQQVGEFATGQISGAQLYENLNTFSPSTSATGQ